MSILNILLCVGVVNLISPAFGDINANVTYYNPVAAVLVHGTDQNVKPCPGALVWVKHWQVFIGSNTCLTDVGDWTGKVVRAGGEVSGRIYNAWNTALGVGLIFFQGAETPASSFQMTALIMPGILRKHDSEAKIEWPITISRDTWGPHHEVTLIGLEGNNMHLEFYEPLTLGKCPEEVRWGPAMLPSRWSVPLIIGVFKSSNPSTEEDGECKVSLVYTSIIPAVDWIEKTVMEFYEGWGKAKDEETKSQYVAELEKTQKYRQ